MKNVELLLHTTVRDASEFCTMIEAGGDIPAEKSSRLITSYARSLYDLELSARKLSGLRIPRGIQEAVDMELAPEVFIQEVRQDLEIRSTEEAEVSKVLIRMASVAHEMMQDYQVKVSEDPYKNHSAQFEEELPPGVGDRTPRS